MVKVITDPETVVGGIVKQAGYVKSAAPGALEASHELDAVRTAVEAVMTLADTRVDDFFRRADAVAYPAHGLLVCLAEL